MPRAGQGAERSAHTCVQGCGGRIVQPGADTRALHARVHQQRCTILHGGGRSCCSPRCWLGPLGAVPVAVLPVTAVTPLPPSQLPPSGDRIPMRDTEGGSQGGGAPRGAAWWHPQGRGQRAPRAGTRGISPCHQGAGTATARHSKVTRRCHQQLHPRSPQQDPPPVTLAWPWGQTRGHRHPLQDPRTPPPTAAPRAAPGAGWPSSQSSAEPRARRGAGQVLSCPRAVIVLIRSTRFDEGFTRKKKKKRGKAGGDNRIADDIPITQSLRTASAAAESENYA